jgi:hypothetical protein
MPPPVDRTAVERALTRTYDHPSYDDSWEVVEDYQQVQTYSARHPDAGSYAVGRALDLPRGRVRPWMNGSTPDPMRALDTCWTRGWLPDDWDDSRATAWVVIMAAAWGGGSVSSDFFIPRWVVDDSDERAILRGAADPLGIEFTRLCEDPLEVGPANDASVLGRFLIVLGYRRGDKSPESMTSIPDWFSTATEAIQLQAVRTYTTFRDTDAVDHIQIAEDRNTRYREQLSEALRTVVDTPEDVRADTWPIRIIGEAAETLRPLPAIADR